MKKLSLYLWLIALAGLTASCSQDETDALTADATDTGRVTLSATLPADFAQPGTRALPTVKNHQLRCILEVWTQGATPVLKYRNEQVGLSGGNVVFDFKIDDATYDCLFWADFIATAVSAGQTTTGGVSYGHFPDKYYTTNTADGLRAVSITGTDYVKDGEFTCDARDAFFSHAELKKEAGKDGTLSTQLTRPFAKLIIKEKTKAAYNLCKYMTAASYTVPKTFNVLTGIASGNYSVSPDEIYQTGNASINDFTLFSDLIFTSSAGRETLGQISLAFAKQDSNPTELQPVTIPAGVPIQRNHKTNAAGNLISEVTSDKAKVTVTMDAGWDATDIDNDPNNPQN